MILKHGRRAWALALLAATTAVMQGCGQEAAESSKAARPAATSPAAQGAYQPVSVQHKLGTTVIGKLPQRVVALDMNEVDFLDQLGVPVAGMPKDFVPHFLEKYKNAADVQDTGAIVQPNLERVHAAKPDLILITSLQANHYKELSEIAPTIHFDVDYRDSEANHIEIIKDPSSRWDGSSRRKAWHATRPPRWTPRFRRRSASSRTAPKERSSCCTTTAPSAPSASSRATASSSGPWA